MRKDKEFRKGLSLPIPAVYQTYSVSGMNVDYFLGKCVKNGLTLFNVRKINRTTVILTIKLQENNKFFAIAKDLCYNIKKIKGSGFLYPIFYLLKNAGLIIGSVIFIALAVISSDYILDISYSGTGSVYQSQISQYLSLKGVSVYSRFSKIDLNRLQDDILRENPYLSFASCKKVGNRLQVELALSNPKTEILDGNVFELRADCAGVVQSLKIYSGTATVSVGDNVKEGDLLVGGYAFIKEQQIKINVIASVTLRCECVYEYFSEENGEEEKAQLFAEIYYADKQANSAEVEKFSTNSGFVYKVTLSYLRVYCVG